LAGADGEGDHDHEIQDIFKMEVLPHAFTFFSVVKIDQTNKPVAHGVTIKFFFNYKNPDNNQILEDDAGNGDDANFVVKLYDNLIA
jgi:hypothetical protein